MKNNSPQALLPFGEVGRGSKSMTKQQLAASAGVTVRTLMNWCRPYRQELQQMGMLPNQRRLPPHIVKFLSEKFCIDLP